MANRLTVNIGGQTFHLVADETVEYMSMIARTADQKIKEACKETGSSTFSAGVLAVLNIADDAVKAQEELRGLRERYNALEEGMMATQEKLDALEPVCPESDAPMMGEPMNADSDLVEELEAKLAEAEEAAQTAKAQLEEQKAENLRLQVLLDAALARQNDTHNTKELDTYRRAERVERDARNRAREISDKANSALSDATNKVDETAIQISELTDSAMQQLRQLQLAIAGSKQVLRDTATVLYSIRPEDEE